MRICQITHSHEILNEEEIIKRSNGNVKVIANRIYDKILNTMQLLPQHSGVIEKILDKARVKPSEPVAEYIRPLRFSTDQFENDAITILKHYAPSGQNRKTWAEEIVTQNNTARSFKMLVQKAEQKISDPESKKEFLAYSFQAYFGFIIYGWISSNIKNEEKLDHSNLKGNFESLYDRITHLKDINQKFLYLSQLILKYAQRLETKNQPIDIRQILQILSAKDVQLLALNLDRIPKKYQTMLKNETLTSVRQNITNYYKYLSDKYYKTK